MVRLGDCHGLSHSTSAYVRRYTVGFQDTTARPTTGGVVSFLLPCETRHKITRSRHGLESVFTFLDTDH